MAHLISDKLIELVEKHANDILKRWARRLIDDPTTGSFSEKNLQYVEKKAKTVLTNLSRWVSYDTTKEEIGRRYVEEGKDLFRMGIPLCEAHRASVLLRRILWLFVVNESAFDSTFQLHQMRELNDRVILFFDRAHYYMMRGYFEEINIKMKELWDLTGEDTEKIFFNRSFYNN